MRAIWKTPSPTKSWKRDCFKERKEKREKERNITLALWLLWKTTTDHLRHIRLKTMTIKKGNRTQFERSQWCSQTRAASRLHSADEHSRSQRLNTAQVHGRWIINKMSYWLIDLYARHSGFPPPRTHHFNSSHNNSPRCNPHISCSISRFSTARLQGDSVESLPPRVHNLRIFYYHCFPYGLDSHSVLEDDFTRRWRERVLPLRHRSSSCQP